MTSIDALTLLCRMENVIETTVGSGIALLSVEGGDYYFLNETGKMLWGWLEVPHSAEELFMKLSKKYDCRMDQCLPDLVSWLQDNVQNQLLRIDLDDNLRLTYQTPTTSSFDARVIQGSSNEFQTDNFETGS